MVADPVAAGPAVDRVVAVVSVEAVVAGAGGEAVVSGASVDVVPARITLERVAELRTDDGLEVHEGVGAVARRNAGREAGLDRSRGVAVQREVRILAEQVLALGAVEAVIARPTDEPVDSRTAVDVVVALVAADEIDAVEAVDRVVATEPDDDVVGTRADENVVAGRADDRRRLVQALRDVARRRTRPHGKHDRRDSRRSDHPVEPLELEPHGALLVGRFLGTLRR